MSVQDITIPKRYVYTQATTPTGATEGSLWYNTTSKILKTYDGSTWSEVTTDLTELEQQQLEQNINILINSASASSTLNDYDVMFLDIFTDSSGHSNTIDTGNTTADFAVDKYANNGGGTEETNPTQPTTTESITGKCGMRVQFANSQDRLVCTKTSQCTATKAYVQTAYGSGVLATADFVGNVATFSGLSLSASTDYYILVDKEGSSYNNGYNNGGSYPNDTGEINWVAGYNKDGNTNSTYSRAWQKIAYGGVPEDLIVQTNAETITSNPLAHQLYCHNTLAGEGSVTYDVSFDGGSTWVTGQSLNTKNTDVHNGSSMVIKINLNGVGAGNTSSIKDYAIMLYY